MKNRTTFEHIQVKFNIISQLEIFLKLLYLNELFNQFLIITIIIFPLKSIKENFLHNSVSKVPKLSFAHYF